MRGNELKPSCPPPEKENIASPNNINISYAYLPNGDRIVRQNETSTTYYLYDREDRIGDYDINGNLITAYTHSPGIDEPVAMTMNNSTYFYIPDIQSIAIGVCNAIKTVGCWMGAAPLICTQLGYCGGHSSTNPTVYCVGKACLSI